MLRARILFLTLKSLWLCFVYLASTSDPVNGASLCPEGRYLKAGLYCVTKCGPGYYGSTQERSCQICSSNCMTCLDGKVNNKCSSCNDPLYLKGTSCVRTCEDGLTKGPPATQIRLVMDGKSQFEGRVEINHDGVWGTVCDDSWDINDANVVCRELLLGSAQEAVSYGRLGKGKDSQPIWLSMLKCSGKETRLERCPHNGWGNHPCSHNEDAGVRCAGPDTTRECVTDCGDGYYLKKGKKQCGVCSPSCLTCVDSPETCTSCDPSKYRKGKSCVTSCGRGFYGDTSDRQCKPCDPGCSTCADGTSSTTCTSCPENRYLNGSQCVISCAPRLVGQKPRVRLAGANSTELQGRLEVFRNGAWGTVCGKTFDFREATVVCRQLGLGSAVKAVKTVAVYGRGSGVVWANDLNCTGRERNLFDCPTGLHHRCYHDNDVGVVCKADPRTVFETSKCLKHCKPGWFKNDIDVCDLCATQCAECAGRSYRCTKCKAPKFLANDTCVDKCAVGKYGHLPSRECQKCNTAKCMTCADGSNENSCTSCKPPKALKKGKCDQECGPDLYQKNGVCVQDCGDLFYKFAANSSCLPCPAQCLQCKYTNKAPQCTVCAPPLVFENGSCVTNCSSPSVAVPITNGTFPSTPLLRLTNGSDYLEGVLEVFHDGVWGTVCDDGWDAMETSVVCKELGLGTADDSVASLDHIQKLSTGKQWLDDVFCTGNEIFFSECRHRPWGETNCRQDEDTVLRCTGPGVRTCKDSCPPGFYTKGKECLFCNFSCSTCKDGPGKCVKCSKGYYTKNGTCVADCGRGYYLDNTCKKCDSKCGSCEGKPDNCTSCDLPTYKRGSTCVADCAPTYNPSSKPQVRLVNGPTPMEGRVEILHAGRYGTVCDDMWDIKDANVVCNMLGMGNATAPVFRGKYNKGSSSNGPIWMDDVQCLGNETSLANCPFRGWERENCDHNEDAGVICSSPGNMRDCLSSCNTNNGYFLDTAVGPRACGRCSDNCQACSGNLENCTSCPPNRFLNLTEIGNATYNCVPICIDRYFPDPITEHCNQCDSNCFNCEGQYNNCTSCDTKKFLSETTCVAKCPDDAWTVQGVESIRLVGANSTLEGRVEILHEGSWGTVCDDMFDLDDAHVVCRQLKLGKAIEARNRAKYGQGTGKIWIDDLRCVGTEKNIKDCQMNAGGIGKHNCRHTEDAGVKCLGPDMSLKCVKSCGDGFYKGQAKKCERCSLNCKTCKDKADSCTSCNFPFFYSNSSSDCVVKCPPGFYGNTKENLCKPCDKVCQTCSNGESGDKCQSCPNGRFLNISSCVSDCGDLSSVSSLFPSKPAKPVVRLVGGLTPSEGRVTVLYDGVWGTVCDDGWDLNDASVVCKELGFGNAKKAVQNTDFGKGSGIIWMDNVNCIGFESSLTHCQHAGWGQGNCESDHSEDAGVICDNTTVKELSNNFCRQVNIGSCADHQLCDSHAGVTCVDLDLYNQNGEEESVCMQCPDGYTGDGRQCRVVASSPPVFDVSPANNLTVQFQNAFSLRCSSRPPVVYPSAWDWKKDGQPLSADDIIHKRITSSSGTLIVRFAVAEDSGNYTCALVNSVGAVENSGTIVTVKVSPQIPEVKSADVYEGDTATLACLVSSFPPSNITWRRHGSVLSSNDNKYTFIDSNFTLLIKNAKFEDAGDYECEATNELGGAVANANLSVGLTMQYTKFAHQPTKAAKGKDVTLPCVVKAYPVPKTAWKKDGELVTKDDRHKITYTGLTIKQVERSDMGKYSCVAWNGGSAQAKSTLLLITGPPIIDIGPVDQYVLSGATVLFYCVGYGDPQPQFTWNKNGESVKESDRIKISKSLGYLQISSAKVEDAGTYECIYSNKLGEDKKSVVLNVDGQAGVAGANTGAKSHGLSTGALIGIIIAVLLIIALVIAVIVYKCRKTRYYRGDRLVDKPARFSDLKSRFGRTTEVPYQEDID